MKSAIWDKKSGKQIGWVDGRDVYSLKTEKPFATVGENGNLYGLDGKFLNVHLENSDSGTGLAGENSAALENFKKLASFN